VRLTTHARERLAARGLTEEDIVLAMRRRIGPPQPGARPDTVVHRGTATVGRTLKVVTDSTDYEQIVTAMWEEARSS
jgi:hypothetical protein